MTNQVSNINKPIIKQTPNYIATGIIANINAKVPEKNADIFKPQLIVAFPDELNVVDGVSNINAFDIGEKNSNTLAKIKSEFNSYYNSTAYKGFSNPDYDHGVKKNGWAKDDATRNKLINLMAKYGVLRRIERDENGIISFDTLIENIIKEIQGSNILFFNSEEKEFEEFNKNYLRIIFNEKAIPDYKKLLVSEKSSAVNEDEKKKFEALLNFISAPDGNSLEGILGADTLAMWRKIYYKLDSYAYWDRTLAKLQNGYVLNIELPKEADVKYESIGQSLLSMLKETQIERKYGETAEVINTLTHPYSVTFGSLLGGKIDKKTYNFAEFLIDLSDKDSLEVQGVGKAYAALFAKQVSLNNHVALYNIYNIEDVRMQGKLKEDGDSTTKSVVKLLPAKLAYSAFAKYDIESLSIYEYENLSDEQKLSVIFYLSAVKGAKIAFLSRKHKDILPAVAGLYPRFNAYGYNPKIVFMPFVNKLTFYTESASGIITQDALEDAMETYDFGEVSEEDQLALTQELSTSEIVEQTIPEAVKLNVQDAEVEEAPKSCMTKKTLPKK